MLLNNILRLKKTQGLSKVYLNFLNYKNFCVQTQKPEEKEVQIQNDLVCEEFSPLQNAFFYNEENKLKEYMQFQQVEDKEDGTTILYNVLKEPAYFKGFTKNDSLGSITQNMIEFREKNGIKNLVIMEELDEEYENPLPEEKPLEKVDVPLDSEFDPDYIHTVSDYTHFTYYGQKFTILEYEIMALKEKYSSTEQKYFYEWIPMTVIQTEINGKMEHLAHYDGQSQQEQLFFEELFLKKKIFPKHMKSQDFFDNFSTTTDLKKNFQKFNEEKIKSHFTPGSVVKAYKDGFSDVGVYLSPDEVIMVDTTYTSKVQDLQLVRMFKNLGNRVADEYYKENQQKEQMNKVMRKNKAAVQSLEEKTHFDERKREEPQKEGFLSSLFKSKNEPAKKKIVPKRRNVQARRRNINDDQNNRFISLFLKPFKQKVPYRIVSFKEFSQEASEIRQTIFKVQFYTPEELKERMNYLNKKKPHLSEIYPSFQAYYLACGYKASPILTFSKIWNAYFFTSTTNKFLLFWLILSGVLMCIPSYRNRFLKQMRRFKRKWNGSKIVFSHQNSENDKNQIGEAQQYFRATQSSYAAKLKMAQQRAYEKELMELQTDEEVKSAVARKQKGIADKLKEKMEQQKLLSQEGFQKEQQFKFD